MTFTILDLGIRPKENELLFRGLYQFIYEKNTINKNGPFTIILPNLN